MTRMVYVCTSATVPLLGDPPMSYVFTEMMSWLSTIYQVGTLKLIRNCNTESSTSYIIKRCELQGKILYIHVNKYTSVYCVVRENKEQGITNPMLLMWYEGVLSGGKVNWPAKSPVAADMPRKKPVGRSTSGTTKQWFQSETPCTLVSTCYIGTELSNIAVCSAVTDCYSSVDVRDSHKCFVLRISELHLYMHIHAHQHSHNTQHHLH